MAKTVVITGADRGMGLEIVKEFLARGFTVFAGKYRANWNDLEQLQDQHKDKMHIVEMDVSSTESVKKATDYIKSKTETLDVIVNVAGIALRDGADITDELDYDLMMTMYNINALGAIRVVNGLIGPLMKGADKMVINISSEAGSNGQCWRENMYGYCMSKCALNMFSNILFNWMRARHPAALVFAVHPGWVQGVLSAAGALDPNQAYAPPPENNDEQVRFAISAVDAAKGVMRCYDDRFAIHSDHATYVTYAGNVIEW